VLNKSIFKDSFIYLIGELLARSLPFLMLPYLTRKLGTEGFGELSYYLIWLGLFSIFIGLSQEGAIARYYYFYGKRALNTVVQAGYVYNLVISLILFLLCWLLKAEIMGYIVLAAMFQSFVNVQLALRQCQKQPYKYIIIQLILSITNVIFTILALEFFINEPVKFRIVAIVVANFLTFIIVSMILGKLFSDKNKITKNRLRLGLLYIFSFGLPLILHQLSFFVKGQIDRVVIYKSFSLHELGIYSAAIQVSAILPVILMAVNKAILPYYYEKLKNNDVSLEKIKKYSIYSFAIVFVPSIFAAIIPENLYSTFLGNSFIGVKKIIILYLIGYGLIIPYLIIVNYYFYTSRNKCIARYNLISTGFYFIFLIIFSDLSLNYIPFALILSNFVLYFLLFKNIRR
jgi:O-antigen/teichoic acid export membrane protein